MSKLSTNHWDKIAKKYNFIVRNDRAAYQKIIDLTTEYLGKNKKVLEIGSGPGILSIGLAPHCEELIVTDFSESMLSEARKNLQNFTNIKIKREDAQHLSFEDSTFDVIFMANSLHVIPNPNQVLAECSRVLKDAGILIVPNFVGKNVWWRLDKIRHKIFRRERIFYNNWTEQEYLRFLKSQGWEIIKSKLIKSGIDLVYVVATPKVKL